MAVIAEQFRRWPRIAAAAGAAMVVTFVALQLSGVQGPWQLATGLAAAVVLLGSLAPVTRRTVLVGPLASSREGRDRAALASADTEQLLNEIEKHKRLERELILAKQAAEAATMAKGEFLATMSHEIRTPLNGVIPLLELLMSTPLSTEQRDYVQTASGSAQQLLRIVDDILDYSKLEANKVELESVGLNLKEMIDSVLRLMEKAAEAKNIALNLNIDPAVRLAVRGDPVRLRQILTNLLSNAVKFTDRGSVTLTVTRRGEARTHHEIRFDVRDTGVGISPESAARLFKPFSQADTSTTRTYGGTGLGLVICKRIVDLWGGQIGVESQPGRGSLFWFQLPLLKAHGDIGARKREFIGAKVLLLTALPAQQRRFSQALPNWGATFVHAANTQDATAKLRAAGIRGGTWAFDLLLVDAGSVPTTVLALHRSVMREPSLADLQIVYMRGDMDLPTEISESGRVRILSRDMSDADLRLQVARAYEGPMQPPGLAALPAGEAAVTETPQVRGPALAPDAPIRGHVLLVEDNPVNRQVAQRLLTLTGLTLDCAENGREALELLGQGAYDAVFMDCQMPIMDGYAATRQQRRNEIDARLPHTPIIAMTANAMVGDREKCLACGMDDYLSKPLNRGLLEEVLRRWLPATPVSRAASEAILAEAALTSSMPLAGTGPRPIRSDAVPPRAPAAPHPPAPNRMVSPMRPTHAAAPSPPPATPVAASRANAPALNSEIVDDLREIMGSEFTELVRVFLEDAPLALGKLEMAAARDDVDALVAPSHTLKSTSANLGALSLSEIARAIEHGARQRSLSNAREQVADLGREFHRVESALRAFLG